MSLEFVYATTIINSYQVCICCKCLFCTKNVSLSRSSHLQIPIREIIMDAFLPPLLLSAYAVLNAQWLKNIYFLETKKTLTKLSEDNLENEIFSFISHEVCFRKKNQMTRRNFFPFIYSFPLKVCLSAATTVQCAQKMGPAAPNPSFFFSLTFESKLSFWVDAHKTIHRP